MGIRGFVYVGQNLVINKCSDISGAAWVVGNVTNNATGDRVLVYYEPQVVTPLVLNVVLVRKSWDEVSPSGNSW